MKPKKSPGKGQGTLFSFFSKETPSNKLKVDNAPQPQVDSPQSPTTSSTASNTVAAATKQQAKLSNTVEDELVGKRVRVFWPDDEEWYFGNVIDYSSDDGKHMVHYADGDRERVVLANEKVSGINSLLVASHICVSGP